jgi:Fe2+ transport system protein FeoA
MNMGYRKQRRCRGKSQIIVNNLASGCLNIQYTIKKVETNDNEIRNFLFTLGCYEGEKITIISILANQYVVVVKDSRYSIDNNLAECIVV